MNLEAECLGLARFELDFNVKEISLDVLQKSVAVAGRDILPRVFFAIQVGDFPGRIPTENHLVSNSSQAQDTGEGQLLVERHAREFASPHPRHLDASAIIFRNVAPGLSRIKIESVVQRFFFLLCLKTCPVKLPDHVTAVAIRQHPFHLLLVSIQWQLKYVRALIHVRKRAEFFPAFQIPRTKEDVTSSGWAVDNHHPLGIGFIPEHFGIAICVPQDGVHRVLGPTSTTVETVGHALDFVLPACEESEQRSLLVCPQPGRVVPVNHRTTGCCVAEHGIA